METNSKDKLKFFVFLGLIAIIVFLYIYFDLHEKVSVEGIKNFITGMGAWAPLVYLLTYIVTSIIIFPNLLLSTASGVIWGPYLGTVYTVLAATIACIFPFWIARLLGRQFVIRKAKGTKVEICERFIGKNGFVAIMIVRLIPLFPWEVVNYGSGMCSIQFRHYVLATLIGTIPGSFTYNLIGDSIGKPLDHTKIAIIFTLVSLMVVFTILYNKFWRK